MRNKFICNKEIAYNWWDYYLVKFGLKKNVAILLNTKPQQIILNLDSNYFLHRKSLLKTIFKLTRENRIDYYGESNDMVIYSADRKLKNRSKLDISAIETIERMLNLCLNFKEYNPDLFLLEINKNIKFLIRKNIVTDIGVLSETFLKDEYLILYPYIKGGVVLDIGSYIADSSIMFSTKGAEKVYSYEPHPDLYKIALMNIELNNLGDKILIKNFGVGDKEDVLNIKEDSILGASSYFGLQNYNRGKEIAIKIFSLQRIIEEIGEIDVLKMDCEGAEFKAILSCPLSYLKKIKVMLIEYHDNPLPLISYLKEAGFKVDIKKEGEIMHRKFGLLFAILRAEGHSPG
jgi:FkbM family methyltransferase